MSVGPLVGVVAGMIAHGQALLFTFLSIELLFTGGGHDLPMVTALKREADAVWTTSVAAPDFAERSDDPDFQSVRRQVAVAVGGAIRDLPALTAPVRL